MPNNHINTSDQWSLARSFNNEKMYSIYAYANPGKLRGCECYRQRN